MLTLICQTFGLNSYHNAYKMIRLGDDLIVDRLIKAGADVNFIDADGCNSLHYAASGGKFSLNIIHIK